MLRCSLWLATLLAFTRPPAFAQHVPGAARFPGFSASSPTYSAPALVLPASPVAAVAAHAAPPIPTRRAAAAYAPLVNPATSPPVAETAALAPQRDLTGAKAGPPYDLYQNLPEEFRKRTLPAVWAEPVALQLLRGALGR